MRSKSDEVNRRGEDEHQRGDHDVVDGVDEPDLA